MKITHGLLRITAAFVVVAAVVYAVASSNRARANAECERTFRQLAASIGEYVRSDEGGHYPALSSSPGLLAFSTGQISTTGPKAGPDPGRAVDATKYWYLGWMIPNERSGLEWIEQYRKHQPPLDAIPLFSRVEVWPEFADDIAAKQKALDERWLKNHPDGKPHPGMRDGRPVACPLMEEVRFYGPLREGVERLLITDAGNPFGGTKVQSLIPVLIERPEVHGHGGHVSYMDGHVEFVPYPGKFPMTTAFIEGLRSLDSLQTEKR